MVSVKGGKCWFLKIEQGEVKAGEIMYSGTLPGLFMLLTKEPRERRKLPVLDTLSDGYK